MGIKIDLYKGIGVYSGVCTSTLFFESLLGIVGVSMDTCWVGVSY